ncbi:PBECR2 nuclease fold domain-containing protein [Ruixingdingia sedimenti]|uniref:PBECR2 nuclease fold domain-containing protein n=1 Tax=Ruixingdingia sedimenti TaxID=3073604 RepID=A0ABU1FEE4_9RHOB|nr:PBECR2 nuclease fold domain-containing protein [Xinfangfangia sp. LG-4]MDR5655240.1 PBECR2 nuclease fold domain-containing protein [Xinfangfangia sp. LG-4]
MVASAEAFEDIQRGLLELAAAWTPNAFGALLGQAMELARYEGREAVFLDAEEPAAFAEPRLERQEFREQIDFLTQKRVKPTEAWTDAMRGDHDRAFVVAGATDLAMLNEFHTAVIEAARTYDTAAFARDFDRIVEKYGWSYNGGREWRIRTIVETNIRTSYAAGRLKQMRDPDMVRLRPYWQYIHADSRVPLNPRPQHVAWDGMILRWDDPWWDIYFPPNDWQCSCGVRTLSRADLRRMGKEGPDTAPEIVRQPYTHKGTGQTVMQPEGTGFGWDYMPGDQWQRGLAPILNDDDPAPDGTPDLPLIAAAGWTVEDKDRIETIDELRAKAKPFKHGVLPEGQPPEVYAAAFLEAFGLSPGEAMIWTDVAGDRLLVSDDMFRQRDGAWKTLKRGHGDHALLLAETLMDPDEIWISFKKVPDPEDPNKTVEEIVRRYIRIDPDRPVFAMFELGRKIWFPVTGYGPLSRANPDFAYIDRQRFGKRIWKRK